MKPWNRKWFANSVFKLHWIYIRSETHNSFDSTRCIWSSLNWERDNPYHISKYNLASSWYFAETFFRNTTNEISRSAPFLTICLVLGWQSHLCNGPNVEIAVDQDYRHHGDRKCNIICTELSLIHVKTLGQPYLWYWFQCKCTIHQPSQGIKDIVSIWQEMVHILRFEEIEAAFPGMILLRY